MPGSADSCLLHVDAPLFTLEPLLPPRAVVLSTAALSNEFCLTSTGSSLTWWRRRWGHAENSSLSTRAHPGVPPADPLWQPFFSHCRVRWGVSGRAPHCSTGRKEQIVLFQTDLSGNTLRGLLVCAHRRQPCDWTCKKHETHMQDGWYRWNTRWVIFVDLHN